MLDVGCWMLDVPTLMSDSLDPTDAIVGGVAEAVKRLAAFILVTAGAAVLGLNLHNTPKFIASIRSNGFSGALNPFSEFDVWTPLLWIFMMMHSAIIWYLLPFLGAYVWLLFRLWQGADMFSVLLALALIHPIHVFIYVQRSDPLPLGELTLAGGLLVVSEIAIAGLILWWRHIKETAPVETTETEPEL
jgi:hypothetical protein